MTIERMRSLRLARPFQPFTIHLRDGKRIPIRRGDAFALSPTGARIVVVEPRYQSIFLDAIADVTLGGARRRKRAH